MFNLEKLPYAYDALEPYIDAKTMEIHYTKHHQTYVDKLNAALQSHSDLLSKNIWDLIKDVDSLPQEIKMAVQNNGGGHLNHTMFWKLLKKDINISEGFKQIIEKDLGSFEKFKEQFSAAALTRFGSGWAWLVVNKGKLEVMSTANQDNPISVGKNPILGIDVWEHAYYLKYQNRRPEYIEAFFKIINWERVEKNYKNVLELNA